MWSKFDLDDFWEVKIKFKKAYDPLRTQCVEITWAEHETQITQTLNRKGCSFYSQINKIVWLSNMADTFFLWNWCAKVCGLFFLNVLFGCWLARRRNSNHVYCTDNKMMFFRHTVTNVAHGQKKMINGIAASYWSWRILLGHRDFVSLGMHRHNFNQKEFYLKPLN